MIFWGDINARARGLATHLLSPRDMLGLAQAKDLAGLAAALGARGFLVPEATAPSPTGLELGIRRHAAEAIQRLTRWVGPRAPVLAVVLEDEDRRALRAILRGAIQGAPADRRLGGLIPTITLPERALATLAALPSVREVSDLLVAWRNPYGTAIQDLARAREPDAFRLEVALNRTFAARAQRAARQGGRELRDHVVLLLDLENAMSALLLREAPDVTVASCMLDGGRRMTAVHMREVASAGDPVRAAHRIAMALAGTPVAAAFADAGRQATAIEAHVLSALVRSLRHRARLAPLGPAPTLAFALRLRAQVMNLQRLVWGLALGAGAGPVTASLVAAS